MPVVQLTPKAEASRFQCAKAVCDLNQSIPFKMEGKKTNLLSVNYIG